MDGALSLRARTCILVLNVAERRTVSSVFDFHLDGPGDIVLGDVIVKLLRAIEKKVHGILHAYCWEVVLKGTVGAKNGHTETYLLPMTIAEYVVEVFSGINSWLAGHTVELNELHALRISGSEADDKFADLASTFCRPLEERVSRQSTPPPPPVEAVFRRMSEQKFPFGIPLELLEALDELAENTFLAFTPIGALADIVKRSYLIPRLCDLMRKYGVFETGCQASTPAGSPSSRAPFSATAHYGGTSLASKPPRSSQGAGLRPSLIPAARASLGSAVPMPRAPMPRMSDGPLLPRALAGLRVSAGAGAQVPPRIPRPSGSVPFVLPLAPAASVYR